MKNKYHKIRDYETRQEKELTQTFATTKRIFEIEQEKYEKIVHQIDQLNHSKESIQISELSNYYLFLEKLEKDKVSQGRLLQSAQEALELAKKNLMNKKIEVKKYEHLIEKEKEKEKKFFAREEQKQLDEVALRLQYSS